MINNRIASCCLVGLLPLAASFQAAAAQPSLTITAAQLLGNDRPGPANESTQTLTVTAIRTSTATHGTATFANGLVTYTPDAGFAGAAVFFYTACDNGTTNGQPDPKCSETTITVNVVVDHPPTANSLAVTTAEDSSVAVDLTASDPDGDTINYVIVTQPSHGTLSGTPPVLTYVPAPDFNGPDSFTFAANDGQIQSTPVTVSITVTEVNDSPVPQPDRITVATGNPAVVPTSFLLANDVAGPFNESNQTLTVTSATAGAATHGTVTLSAGGVTYTPDAGFTGTSVIPYTVCDNGTTNGQPDPRCANSTLTIVLNSPPVANAQTAKVIRSTPLALVLSAADPDNDGLQYAIVSPPQNGTLTGTPPAVTYVANSGFVGNDTFTFTAADPYSTSNAATVSIVVQDVPPVVLGADSLTVAAGGSVLVNVLANDVAGTGIMVPATLVVSTPPTKGVAVVQAGQILYSSTAGASGADSFVYKACDTGGACGTATVTATITTNHSPTAQADSYQIAAGKTLTVTAPGLLANDSDPDVGDKIQARLGTGVSAGNLLLISDGSFTYTPATGFAGVDSFTYFDVDSSGLPSPPVTVSINVIPAGPLAVDDTYQTTAGNPLTVGPSGVLANDSDSHSSGPLTAALNRDAIHGTVALNSDGSFVYTPDPTFVGSDSFLYVASDLQGLVSTPAHVTLNVTGAAKTLPTVTVASPVSGGCVRAPTGITATITAPSGESITQWSVSSRNVDGGTPVVLASGSGAPPQTLASFDPTLLVNGAYEILTTAASSGGGSRTFTTDVCVAGNNKLGDYQTTYLDMQTAIAGFVVQVMRTYDSTDSRQGDFGIGWRLALSGPRATPNGRLGESGWSITPFGQPFTQYSFSSTVPHFVTVTSPGGRVEVFDFVPVPTGPLLSLTSPAFVARPGTGTTSTLEDVDSPTLSLAGDSLAGFFDGSLYDPHLFRLTTKDGVVMYIDRITGLQYMSDRNGNALAFDANGVTAASSNTQRQLAFVRDGAGRITEIDGPNGMTTLYGYSGTGDLNQFTDANGNANTFSYNGAHRLLTVVGPGGTKLRTLNYGPDGRLTSLTDGTGRTITFSSNVTANSQIVTSPSGGLTTLSTYGADGNLASKEEAFNGHSRVTSYQYDSEGRLTQTTKPLGRIEKLSYDAAGNLTSRTTPKNETWTYAFNALNEPTTTTAPDGTVIESFTYDGQGNLTTETNRDGTAITYTNNSQGLPLTATDSFGTTSFAYDADQQLITRTDPAGGVTRQAYDSSGNATSIQDPAGQTTQFAWNAIGKPVQVTTPNGSTYKWAYDALGRLTSSTDTIGRTETYAFDAANRLVVSVNRANRTTSYAYDPDGNLASATYADGDVQAGTWDPVGRLVSLADADTIVERAYNDADDLVSERTRGNNGVALPDVTLAYTTDADGQRLSNTGPGGTISYAYDSRGRLSSLQDSASGLFKFAYDTSTDRLITLSRPNNVNDLLGYQENYLTARDASIGGSTRARADYALDSLGRRTSLTDLDGNHAFSHDPADRLTSATHPAASGLAAESFAYDTVGNRTSWSGSPPGPGSYDAGMQLSSDGTYDYTYDGEGRVTLRRNRATGGTTSYTWSDAGRLTSVTMPGGTISTYRYDALGRRLEVNDNGAIRRFVYSGWNLSNEFDGTNALRATYVAGLFPDNVYEIVRDGTRYYPLFDGLGSVTTLTDATGAAVGRVRYSAFGVPQSSGVTENAVSFTGHQFDAATGLDYARARYYDPTLGRFLSQDPKYAVNPYVYALDAPLEFTDPTGRDEAAEQAAFYKNVMRVFRYYQRHFALGNGVSTVKAQYASVYVATLGEAAILQAINKGAFDFLL